MKKLISTLLVLAMVFAMMPTLALIGSAEGEGAIVLPGDCFHSRLSYTDNQDGETHTVTCTDCHATINASEAHTFSNGVCTLCGASESVEDPYLVEGLDFYNVSLNIQSYIGVDYMIRTGGSASVLKNYDSYYAVIAIGDEEGVVFDSPYTYSNNYKYYELTCTATQMTETLTATLYAVKDGVTYHGAPRTYSIRQGVMGMIDNYAAKETLTAKESAGYTFAVDMLNYGANAQVRFENRVDDLANNQLTSANLEHATSGNPVLTETTSVSGSGTATFYRTTLSLGATIEIQSIIKNNGLTYDNMEAHVSYGETSLVIPLERSNNSYSYFIFSTLPVTEVRTTVSITIYDKTTQEPVSGTWTGSIAALASALIAQDSSNADAINAMMRYGDSAYAYFNS